MSAFIKTESFHMHGTRNPKDTGVAGEYIKRHLQVTGRTEGKRKLINSNLNSILHKFIHFAMFISESSNKNKIIKTQPVLFVCVCV